MMKREERWIEKDSLRLLRLDRSRYATPGQDQTGQQCHLHAVGLAVAHAEAAEPVLPRGRSESQLTGGCKRRHRERGLGNIETYEGANGHAGCHRRYGARADVAGEPAAGSEDGQEESLGCGIVLFV